MDLHTLESHRRTVGTRTGDVSCIDVGEGPPALFVHGVGTNAYLWRNVLDRLAAERRCIALDLPLHGHSPATPDQDLTLDGLADAVDAFCEADGLVNIDLVAHDTGGAVAQIVAARRPERLRTFTLTNCDVHDNVPPEAFAPTVELAKAGALAPSAPALLADLGAARTAVFGTGYEHPEQLDLEIVRAFLEPVIGAPERARRFEELLAAMEPRYLLAVEPALARLEVQTLVVWGTADEFFDVKWAYWLRDLIPGAREVVEIEGAKLFFPDERAGELVPHLRRHWAGASSERVAS
jgi:pimeloyl-ACP methyl ester carboxylesterase